MKIQMWNFHKVNEYLNIRLKEIRRILTDKYTSLLERVEPNELQ